MMARIKGANCMLSSSAHIARVQIECIVRTHFGYPVGYPVETTFQEFGEDKVCISFSVNGELRATLVLISGDWLPAR